MNTPSKWRIAQSTKEEYLTVWKVQRRVNGQKQIAFFKFPQQGSYKYIGPLLANKLVWNQSGHRLPVAKTVVARIRGKSGNLSFSKHKSRTWNRVMKGHSNPFRRIANPKLLYRTFAFDVWIHNVDQGFSRLFLPLTQFLPSNKFLP